MSLETAIARGEAHAADVAWKHHLGTCSSCAKRPRMPRCQQGADLFRDKRVTAAVLAESRRLDRTPLPDQEGFW